MSIIYLGVRKKGGGGPFSSFSDALIFRDTPICRSFILCRGVAFRGRSRISTILSVIVCIALLRHGRKLVYLSDGYIDVNGHRRLI